MSWNECPSCGLALRSTEEMEAGLCSECSPLQIKEKRHSLVSRIRAKRAEMIPPYLFPETKDELCPGLRSTTVGEIIEDTWRCAFDAALEAVAEWLEEEQQ